MDIKTVFLIFCGIFVNQNKISRRSFDRRLLHYFAGISMVKRTKNACDINDAVMSAPTTEKNRMPSSSGHNEIAMVTYKNFFATLAQPCLPVRQYIMNNSAIMQVSSAVIKGEKFAYPNGRRLK